MAQGKSIDTLSLQMLNRVQIVIRVELTYTKVHLKSYTIL